MSYALGATSSRANGRIDVGAHTGQDVILARASYEAAAILKAMMERPRAQRPGFVREQLRRYGTDIPRTVRDTAKRMRARGVGENQALFDAMRLEISKHYALRGIEVIQAAVANIYGADQGLGDDTAKAVGCGITGGVTAIGGAILGAYTGGAAATPVAAGGQIVAGAIGCNAAQQEAAQAAAASQAQAAQAMADAAAAQAQRESQAQEHAQALAEQTTERLKVGLIVGGGLIVLLATGYMIVKL